MEREACGKSGWTGGSSPLSRVLDGQQGSTARDEPCTLTEQTVFLTIGQTAHVCLRRLKTDVIRSPPRSAGICKIKEETKIYLDVCSEPIMLLLLV